MEKEQVVISVIIPVYNGEMYICDICKSLEEQTYKNYEVIFVDDGSTDGSYQTLNQLKKDHYTIIHQENRGVSAARNTGIHIAKGQYIAFIDVDDTIHPEYLHFLHSKLEDSQRNVVYCDTSDTELPVNLAMTTAQSYTGSEALRQFLFGKIQTGVCGMLIPKTILTENQLCFKENYKYSEDLHMVWRIFNFADKVIHVKAPLYVYKKNDGSAMTKISVNRLDSINLMKDLECFFSEQNEEFYPLFKKYGVARVSWSLLWQVAHYSDFSEFTQYLNYYPFANDLKKLFSYPDLRVRLSSFVFLLSKRLYYHSVKRITRSYRNNHD